MNHRFLTDLSVEECERRIRELRAGPRLLEPIPVPPAKGEIVFGGMKRAGFILTARRVMARNNFRPLFYGRLKTTSSGTRIEGEFRVPLWVRLFTAGMSFFMGLFFLLQLLIFMQKASPSPADWIPLAVPAVMLLGIASMVFFGRKVGAAAEQEDVLAFIRERLEASASGFCSETATLSTALSPKRFARRSATS